MTPAKIQQLLREAVAHHDARRFAEAAKRYTQLRAVAPHSFDVFHLSGWLAFQENRMVEAAELLGRAAKLNSRSGLCALRLAHALRKIGRLTDAHQAAVRAAELEPQNADAHFCVGELAGATLGFSAAIPSLRRVTELQPEAADGWANLGVALAQSGAREEALACFDRALVLKPGDVQALTGKGLVFQNTHRPREAVETYEHVLRLDPARHEAHSARLFALHYLDGVSRERLFDAHKAFGAAVGNPPEGQLWPRNPPDPDRRLRVAFLSPDLRSHSVAYFLEPLLQHLDRERFEIVLYYDHPRMDVMTERLRSYAAVWRHLAGQPDSVAEKTIRADAPDILVELAGHTGRNRLPLLARRLAPVQISYLGYPDTTGVPAIDYRFVDAITDPPGEADAFATEKLIRFAPTMWAYAPPRDAPEVKAPPCSTGAPVTFGCFNNFAKVSDATLRLWRDVLEAVPGSRLLLKGDGLETPSQRPRLEARLAAARIDARRVELLGKTPTVAAHLALHERVDVALDTFPYNGTTTTCDALWMGVPVVTCSGDCHASRVGMSLLSTVNRPEWVARTARDYVSIACSVANECCTFPNRRKFVREDVRRSPLLDHASQTRAFESALRKCWKEGRVRSVAGVTASV